MIKKIILLSYILLLSSCSFETPTEFSEKAMLDQVTSLDGTESTFKTILQAYKGKKVVVIVWASWCADCIKGLATVKQLQTAFPEVVFLFLSVDERNASWKRGIQRFKMKGAHYNLPKGMKDGELVDFLNLSWIPRYLVMNENGGIQLFKATRSSDKRIVEALKK
jgi:thiol-disulfide isomerase/thioredoxin